MSVYLYCRVSTDKQENGREAQVARLQEWVGHKGLSVDGQFVDEDVSAFYTPLSQRPEGKRVWDLLQRGDTLVMTKVDRGFRSWADAATTHMKLRELGVNLRFADLDIDLSTPQGELFFSQIVAFAQFESRMHSQRKKEVYAHKRKTGQPYSWTRPYGWKRTKDKRGKLSGYAVDERERSLGQRVLEMRRAGKSWWSIASDVCLAGDRKPSARQGDGYYHVRDIRALACAAAAGYPTVPQSLWLTGDSEQKLRAMISDGVPLWPAGYDRSETCPVQGLNLGPDQRSPSRESPGSPPRAAGPQPLAG